MSSVFSWSSRTVVWADENGTVHASRIAKGIQCGVVAFMCVLPVLLCGLRERGGKPGSRRGGLGACRGVRGGTTGRERRHASASLTSPAITCLGESFYVCETAGGRSFLYLASKTTTLFLLGRFRRAIAVAMVALLLGGAAGEEVQTSV